MTDLVITERAPRFAWWFADPMSANRSNYLKVGLAAVLINVFAIFTSLFTMIVYDRVVPNNSFDSLIALSLGLALVIVVDFVLKLLRAYFVDVAGADIDTTIGRSLFDRIVTMRMELRKGSAGAQAGVVRELETLRDFFASATIVTLVDVPFMVLTLVVIGLIGKWVVLVPLVVIPVVILGGWVTAPVIERMSARNLREGLSKQSVLVETLSSIETVKAAGAGPMMTRRWHGAMMRQADSSLRQRLVSSIAITIAGTAATVSYTGIVIVGVIMIANHELTTGGLIACSLLSGRAIAPMAQISQLLTRLSATRTAYHQLDEMMNRQLEGPSGTPLVPVGLKGAVELRGVEFTYPGAPEPALAGISLKIRPGEKVALVGPIGSGKSTLLKLVLGLYPAGQGVVLIDGTDVHQFDPAVLRQHIGSAMQDSVLFSGTVRENILLERPSLDDAEMIRAAELSGTHGFIGGLANGYDLRLADRGEGLSGGQRQSITMARAVAGDPQILVFDEPTSAMDPASEGALIARLQAAIAGKTLILVTHRPALLALVDRVVVVERGRMTADGPRAEMLKRLTQPKVA